MTEDKDIERNLKLLDKVLKYLTRSCPNYTSNFDNLYQHIYSRDLSSDKEFHATGFLKSISERKTSSLEELFDIPVSDNTRAQGEKLVEACYFLNKKPTYFKWVQALNNLRL